MAKFYAVRVGRETGIFNTWSECQKQINKFKGSEFKSFTTEEDALNYLNKEKPNQPNRLLNPLNNSSEDFLAVDGGTHGNNSDGSSLCEYQIYRNTLGKMVYQSKQMVGTNNVAEFLGLVKCLKIINVYANSDNTFDKYNFPIYTDSTVAIHWVNNKKCNTELFNNIDKEGVQETIDEINNALEFLNKIDVSKYNILKWETSYWGENPADYGRK